MSSSIDVAVATCSVLPEPDPDAEPLMAALVAAGVSAELLAWDNPRADFSRAKLTLIRSTWNYTEAPERFAEWVKKTARASKLYNPEATVAWNTHKSYLLDLERAGVPTTPTVLVPRGDTKPLARVSKELGVDAVVVKPAVSAGSRGTLRVLPGAEAAGEAHLRALAQAGDVLVQPYLASVEGYGERALVWIDGELTHAIRKSPRFLGDHESVSEAMPIAEEEARLALAAVKVAPTELFYARIDMAKGADGRAVIMELELVEPSLFFAQGPRALDRYVRGVLARLAA